MTCIEDLRQVARRKVPRAFFDYAEAGSYSQETLRANRDDLEHIKLRQRVLVDVSQRDLTTTILGETSLASAGARAHRALRDAARRRRDPGLPGGAGGRDSVHALDHVDLLDRGRGAGGRQAVLVPALRDEGPRLHPRPDRARRGREMQRARAHARPAGAGSAPLRHPQRHDRAAADQARQPHRHCNETGLGAFDPARQAQDLRQPRRPCAGHGERELAGAMDRQPIRSQP